MLPRLAIYLFAPLASASLVQLPQWPQRRLSPAGRLGLRPLPAAPRGSGQVQMVFDRFDRDAMRLVMDAQVEARKLGGSAVGTEHLLLAGTMQADAIQQALDRAGVKASGVRDAIRGPGGGSIPSLDGLFGLKAKDELLPFSKDTERCFRTTLIRSGEEHDWALIGSKDLILSVLRDEEVDAGALQLLTKMGLDRQSVLEEVEAGERELVGAGGASSGKNTTLSQCSVDLTRKARNGQLDPMVGRTAEVRRCMQILVRRRKNNPVLIGDPGVGKTAIAEGLAQAIVEETVPEKLKGKRVLALELGLLVADTKYRGQFEQRLKEVVEEVTASKDTILFIDELHTLVGAGAAEGAIDAANLLKPALARGELQCIGATTVAEYRKYIEKDAALERRFQPVRVEEPTIAQTLEILSGLKAMYSKHHGVSYSEDALVAAAKLAVRYIPDRFLPDKAIDLIDEAGALVQIAAFESTSRAKATPEVGVNDIAAVVAQWTGIPVSKLDGDESRRMLNLEQQLHERVIGQDGAISAISRALRRARVGLRSPRRPVASLVFCGPTGVGKTELAKAVADVYYGSEQAMVRIDMSEYMESHSVSRLTGPPPGYVGYEAGGQLSEAVRRNPHTVVLLDEIEKAHPDVFNILLQVLEDGRLTDNKGRTVDFTNAMLILTSNVGSRTILSMAQARSSQQVADVDDEAYIEMRSAVKRELLQRFRPEFLNRLDEIIVFAALKRHEVMQVAELMLTELTARCAENGYTIQLTPALKEVVVENGFSPTYGARPLRRAMQRLCEDAIAEAILDSFVFEGEVLTMDASAKGGVLLKNKRGKTREHTPPAGQGIEDDMVAPAANGEALPQYDMGLQPLTRPIV